MSSFEDDIYNDPFADRIIFKVLDLVGSCDIGESICALKDVIKILEERQQQDVMQDVRRRS